MVSDVSRNVMIQVKQVIDNSILAYSQVYNIQIEYKNKLPYSYTVSARNAGKSTLVVHQDVYKYQLKTLKNLIKYYNTQLISEDVFSNDESKREFYSGIQEEEDVKIQAFVNVSVIEAKGLYKKMENCNSFVRLWYDDIVYTSGVFKNSLDPRYNLDVFLPVRDSGLQVHVSVWLEGEVFMGSAIVPLSDSYSWIPLGKRSNRSHVSGQILVSVKNILPFKDIIYQYPILNYIPANAESLYQEICLSFLSRNYDSLKKGIETEESRLVKLLEKIWLIHKDTRVGILFEEAVEMFARGHLSATYYYNNLHEDVIAQYKANRFIPGNFRNVASKMVRFRQICETRVKGFFNAIDDIKTPDQLKVLPELMISIDQAMQTVQESPLAFAEKIKGLLEKSVLARFKDLTDASDLKDPITFTGLMKLLDLLIKEIKYLRLDYNFKLLDTINVACLCTNLHLGKVVEILQDFPSIYLTSGMTLSEGFEVYTKSLKFGDLCLSIDSGFRSFLDFSSWFTPLLYEWFKVSEDKMIEWTKNAISMDKFQQESGFEPSTSFTDVLTFLQQQLDFIYSLEWGDKCAKKLMTEKLYQNIAAVLVRYGQILSDMVIQDFKSFSPDAYKLMKKPNIKKRIKFKIKLKNGKKPVLNPGELRLVPEMLVKLVNIHSLCNIFKTLKPVKLEVFKYDTPEGSDEDLFGQSDRFMFKLSVVSAVEIQLSRPYNTIISIRITDSSGLLIGQTSKKIQNITIHWNENFYGFVNSADKKIKLFFEVIQIVPDTTKEYFFARGKTELDFGSSPSNILKLGSFGKILFGISTVDSFDQEFCGNLIAQNANHNIDKLKDLIVEQLCHDFKEKFKKSLFSQQNSVKAILSNINVIPKQEASEEEIDSQLSFFLEYFNTNLDVLTDVMEEKLSFRIIGSIWDRIVNDLESLLVPSLHAQIIDKPLDEKQVSVIQHCFNNLATFFHGEGSGLSSEALKTKRAVQLKLIMDNYNTSKADLNQKYVQLNQDPDVFNEQEGVYPIDWILKLLQLKGQSNMVEKGLKARSNRFILKTLSDT